MKILLTAPPLPDLGDPMASGHIKVCPNLGLYLLAAVAERDGHQAVVVDPVFYDHAFKDPEAMAATMRGVDAIGLSINSCSWPKARDLIAEIDKLDPRPAIVLGGPHPSVLTEHVLEVSAADYVVAGEAERSFPMLLSSLAKGDDPAGTPGINCVRDGKVVTGRPPELLSADELAALPLPRLDLIPQGYYDLLPIESSRGCLHACVFCSVTHRRTWRGLDPDIFAERLEKMAELLPRVTRHAFFIIDDCMSADHARLKAIAERLDGSPHPLVFEARVTDVIADGVIDAVARLNVQVEEAARLIDARGLSARSRFSFIMGLPWETRAEVIKTLEYAFKLTGRLGAKLVVSWLVVFPGSTVWRRRGEWNVVVEAEDYDRHGWWSDLELFKRTHPGLEVERDIGDVKTYALMLMKLFPDVKHDGWFRRLKEERPIREDGD